MKFKFYVFFICLSLFSTGCNVIPFSLNKSTITGKDVKSELKKVDEALVPLSLMATLGSITSASSLSSSSQQGVAKTCIGSYTDDSAPDFLFPSPKDYTNVNLSGNLVSGSPQTWRTSISIESAVSVYTALTNRSVMCLATADSAPTSPSLINTSTTSSFPLYTNTKMLTIVCTTSSTTSVSYVLSLNPRLGTTSTTTSSSSFMNFFSLETLFPDVLFRLTSGLKDSEIYTRDSFEECKKNYQRLSMTYVLLAGLALQNTTQCGGYNPPPPQVYVQASFCPLKPAGVLEL